LREAGILLNQYFKIFILAGIRKPRDSLQFSQPLVLRVISENSFRT